MWGFGVLLSKLVLQKLDSQSSNQCALTSTI